MNRLLFSLTLLFTIQLGQSFTFAQTAPADVLDTLGLDSYTSGIEVLYQSPNGGYVFGTNGYGDLVKARTFSSESFSRIRSVLLKFGEVNLNSGDPNSKLLVRFYALDGLGFGLNGTVLDAPGSALVDSVITQNPTDTTILAFTQTLLVSDILAGGQFTRVNVEVADTSNLYYQNYAVGVDFAQLSPGDTLALFSTSDGDGNLEDRSWELQSSGIWVSTLNSDFGWDLDLDPAIFLETVHDDSSPNGVWENKVAIDVDLFPNPASAVINVSFSTLKNDDNFLLSITDIAGRELNTYDVNSIGLNSSQIRISTSSFANGMYTITLSSNQYQVSKRFEIMH